MEELDLRVSDIKKDLYDFKRDICTQAVNPRTGKIVAEKVLRYYEEKIRDKVYYYYLRWFYGRKN